MTRIETVAAGGMVVKPRGVFHAFRNPGSAPVRFLEVIAPGTFAGYFRELAPLLSGPVRRISRRSARSPRATAWSSISAASRGSWSGTGLEPVRV